MSVLAFDPYFDDTDLLAAKVAKPAKHEEISQFPGAKVLGAVAKAAKPNDGSLAALAGGGESLAPANPQKPSTLAGLAGLAVSSPETVNPRHPAAPFLVKVFADHAARRDDLIAELTASITVPCARCGTPSPSFIAIVNPDGWMCDTCLPADPNDAAHEGIERPAIIAEGRPSQPVLHAMPVSWADATLIPTPGARCRNCNRASWWCEAIDPRGWRCSMCHPGNHLPADRRRDVVT